MSVVAYGFTAAFCAEVIRRFASGDTIREIARDTYTNAADVEALIRAHVRQYEDYEERTEETEWLERD